MHFSLKLLLATVSAMHLRSSAPGIMANGIAEVFTHLVSVLRSDGPTGCATYIDSTLKDLAATYTAVQVPHVLGNVCKSGTYFHSFESADACLKKTEELVKAFEGDKKYGAWCESLATVSESAPAESASAEPAAAEAKKEEPAKECGCVGLPAALIGNSTARKGYPATYGESCAAHDLTTEACSGKYKPAYCYEEWCYVDPSCDVSDKKETFFFQGVELFYSYQHCGGLDAYAAEACGQQKDADTCHAFSSNCAFNKHAGACQNKLCQCTGDNLGINTTKYGFEDSYGESCKAWDQGSCDSWTSEDSGSFELGLWCCKDWCYVDPSCPSAEKSSLKDGLSYSYFACPDDADDLLQCKWSEPIDFGGKPLQLSSEAAATLNEAAVAQ
jgi:hypothetical protein